MPFKKLKRTIKKVTPKKNLIHVGIQGKKAFEAQALWYTLKDILSIDYTKQFEPQHKQMKD